MFNLGVRNPKLDSHSLSPMKKILKILAWIGGGLVTLAIMALLVVSWLNGGTVAYQVQANRLDADALNSYPQIIREVGSGQNPVFTITTYRGTKNLVPAQISTEAPLKVMIFLEPSVKVESDDFQIRTVAAGIAPGETDVILVAQAAARWTAKNIKYDSPLSQDIWHGRSDTRSALATLEAGKGTCSEYANLFIAIMRSKGIPTRFVMGKMYLGSYHAWAEIWVEGQGWIPVDPQRGAVGVSARHIKLFAGRDFVDINVPLREIQVSIKRLGRE